ncbi:hypothetical protein JZ751_004622 [Albula glossodonta]|uniref:Uncharacterized protein n=1 Tax=Albula glossodonta TaxID=121402 RepID=A0A8T2NCP7_9TELE|nr:hypothetical protein JZ751_004622 [Albula glossodonta]
MRDRHNRPDSLPSILHFTLCPSRHSPRPYQSVGRKVAPAPSSPLPWVSVSHTAVLSLAPDSAGSGPGLVPPAVVGLAQLAPPSLVVLDMSHAPDLGFTLYQHHVTFETKASHRSGIVSVSLSVVVNGVAQSSLEQDTEESQLMAIYTKEIQAAEKVREPQRTRHHTDRWDSVPHTMLTA